MMPDYRYDMYRRERQELEKDGYEFEITPRRYKVTFKGEFVGAAGSFPDSYKPRRRVWQHDRADLRDNLCSACSIARQHRVGRREIVSTDK